MSRAELGGPAHHGVVLDDAAVAQLHFVAHDRERADSNILSQLRGRRNDGPGIDFGHRCFLSRFPRRCRGRRLHCVDIDHLAHERGFGGQFAVHRGAVP